MPERPANAPDPNHPLLRAVRANDAAAEAGESIDQILARLGMDADVVAYVAVQRAMRTLLAANGRQDEISTSEPVALSFTAQESEEIARYMAAWLDGAAAAWSARDG